ncbi:hypothetical protein [Arthrobacter sp. NyZ413]|uniref:hypothetical protein n=1 Tax=Arthrobacter sp. NyZ413 TaxID=3144669 RepID=UPI003BF827F9
MSTPHVPPQPNHDPDAGQPASGAGPHQHSPAQPYGPPTQFPPSGQYGAPGQYPSAQYGSGQYPPAHYGQYPGPYGPPPPRPRNRRLLWIVLGVAGAFLVLVIVGAVVLFNVVGSATNKARAASDDFTRLIVNGQSGQAYDQYMHPDLAQNLTKDEFESGVAGLGLDSTCKPHYDSVNVSTVNGTNTAEVIGTLQCQGKTIDLQYNFEGNDPKMDAIRLRPEG